MEHRAVWYQDGQRFRDSLLFAGYGMAAVVLSVLLAAVLLDRSLAGYWWPVVLLPLAPLWFFYLWRVVVSVDGEAVAIHVWPAGGVRLPLGSIVAVQVAKPLPAMESRRHREGGRWYAVHGGGGVTLECHDGSLVHVACRYPELLVNAVAAAQARHGEEAASGEEE